MAEFEAPSFSLGLDFDLLDSEPQITTVTQDRDPSPSNQFSVDVTTHEDEDADLETLVVDDSEPECPDPQPRLKRLRRGSTLGPPSSSVPAKVESHSRAVFSDEDIETFSYQDDQRTDEHLPTQHHAVCSSSEFSLNRQGVLSKQSRKRKQNVSNDPQSVATNRSYLMFPKLTASPFRRFQLIESDSDSDDSSVSEGTDNRKCNGSESYSNQWQSDLPQHVGQSKMKKVNKSINLSNTEHLWEDFRSEKSFHIPTPALDEVCEEYFRSMKDQDTIQGNGIKSKQSSHVTKSFVDSSDTLPPAHRYFFHDDPRIQELVRTRLPNFSPLTDTVNRDTEQPSTPKIDYMGQFSCGESSKQAARNSKGEKSSTGRKTSSRTQKEEASQGWVNPKLCMNKGTPKDAAKRRVHAVGQTAGHWFTGSDGKKVYVGKKGQELTGRAAYRLYRKETGAGFKKTKGKRKAKRKSGAKKK